MVGTQYRCAEPGGAPVGPPAPPAPPAPAPAGTVTSIPTELVTATGTGDDGSAASTPAAGVPGANPGVPSAVNAPVPGAAGTTDGTVAAATPSATSAAGATQVLTTSVAMKNVVELGSAIFFALAAWMMLG